MKIRSLVGIACFVSACSSLPQPEVSLPDEKMDSSAHKAESERSPASFKDEISVIQKSLKKQYRERYSDSDFKYLATFNPLINVSNGLMRLIPLSSINHERIREFEVMHRIFFRLDGKDMDCYGFVREIRGQPGTYFVDVAACNQNFSDFFNWTTEFSNFISSQN